MRNWLGILFGVVAVLIPQAETMAQGNTPLEVGVEAPGFALPGATAEGILPQAVSLDDFTGKTVVLAIFYRVRTKG